MNLKSESSKKIKNVSVQKQLAVDLEKLALKNDSFQKAKHTLTNLSFKVIEIEERAKFLKRCIRTKLLPSKALLSQSRPCLLDLKVNTREAVSEQTLNNEKIENEKVLIAEQTNFINEVKCVIAETESCFRDILLRRINIESQKKRKYVKRRYIELFAKVRNDTTFHLDSHLKDAFSMTSKNILNEEKKSAVSNCYTHQTFSTASSTNQSRKKVEIPKTKYRLPRLKANSNFNDKENTEPLKLVEINAKKYHSSWKQQKHLRQYHENGYKTHRDSSFSNHSRIQPLQQTHMEQSMMNQRPAQQATATENAPIQQNSVILDVLAITGIQAKLQNVDIRGDA